MSINISFLALCNKLVQNIPNNKFKGSFVLQNNRPLSPHLQIYKLQLTSVLSIIHRFTGMFLCLGTVFLGFLLLSLLNPSCFEWFASFWHSWLGSIIFFGWVFSFFYHLANGVRHLFWDAGYGFDLETTYRSGWLVVIVSFALTLGSILGV